MSAPVVELAAVLRERHAHDLAQELQSAAEDVMIHLAAHPTADDDGEEYRRRAARRTAAFRAVVEAIAGSTT